MMDEQVERTAELISSQKAFAAVLANPTTRCKIAQNWVKLGKIGQTYGKF
jgi:hypothetical protein